MTYKKRDGLLELRKVDPLVVTDRKDSHIPAQAHGRRQCKTKDLKKASAMTVDSTGPMGGTPGVNVVKERKQLEVLLQVHLHPNAITQDPTSQKAL
jgi:hypothetical protein